MGSSASPTSGSICLRKRRSPRLPIWPRRPGTWGPKRGADGKLVIALPMGDKKLPGIAVEDIGKCAYGLFKQEEKYIGETVGIAGEHLSGTEMADALTKALGQKVIYNAVTPAIYRGFGFPGADDLGNMFQFKQEFQKVFCDARDLDVSRSLNPDLQTFEPWLARNRDRIQIQ